MKYFSVFNTDTGEWEIMKVEDIEGKGGGGGFVVSTTPPKDTGVLWINPEDNTVDAPNGDNLSY